MADEFQAGLCSPMSWWSTMRTTASFVDLPPPISCSTATGNESISWTQPFLPVELNPIPTGFGDPSSDQVISLLPAGFFEPAAEPLRFDMNDSLQNPWANNKFTALPSPRVSSSPKHQLNFSNSTPFWNPSAISTPVEPPKVRFKNESATASTKLTTMKASETKKQASDHHQPPSKKPRIATPSPLPTFKVRKEKLGDRITALQQLVSPFGKTDTASVLHEAIEYIKFLHGQVGALSTPYLKNGNHQLQNQQQGLESPNDEDLRSRGLCLVPISSTFAVASETPMDFWAPTFLGSYR